MKMPYNAPELQLFVLPVAHLLTASVDTGNMVLPPIDDGSSF